MCIRDRLTGVGMRKLFWASVVMLVAGYFGESGVTGMLDAQTWGAVSGLAYFWIAYEVWFGGLKKLAVAAGGNVLEAHKMLCWFLLVGWAIYPLGYFFGYLTGGADAVTLNVIYNVADVVNKIAFVAVIWAAAVASSGKKA